MPQNDKKHIEEEPISLPYPSEGMNISAAAQFLPPNQAVIIDNMYYDYVSGYLRTRWPFRKYTNNVLNGSPVSQIYKWNGTIYFTSGDRLYRLDSGKNANYVGIVGTAVPCFLPFHGYLLIASGRTPQYLTSSNVLADITGTDVPTTLTQILEINQSVFGIGNTDYPDILFKSAVRDETVWSGGTSANYYLTYEEEPSASLDDLTIAGMAKAPGGKLLVFKRGGGRKATGYLDPNDTSPVWRTVSENESAYTWRSQVNALGYSWLMDEFAPMAIEGIDTDEKLKINQNSLSIGSRIASAWTLDEYAHCVAFPPHAQIWYWPNISTDVIWIFHYLTGAITRFKGAGQLRFYSHYYDSSTKTLYLGNVDGHIYTYSLEEGDEYKDNPAGTDTSYQQLIKTAIFDPFPRHSSIMKNPVINYRSLQDGDGTINFYKDYGLLPILDDFYGVDFTITSTYPSLLDYEDELMIDHEEEYLWASDMQSVKIPFKSPEVNSVQMEIIINTGAIELKGIDVSLAKARKKQ